MMIMKMKMVVRCRYSGAEETYAIVMPINNTDRETGNREVEMR